MDERDDLELVARFLAHGDREALGEVLARHRSACYGLALHVTRSAADAEDACQEAALRAVRGLESFQPSGSFRAWYLRLTYNVATDIARSRRTRRTHEDAPAAGAPPAASPSTRMERAELDAAVAGALAAVEPHYQLPVILRYEQGLSYREAAAVLGLPEGTVRTYTSRGIERLRERLARAGYALAPAAVAGFVKSGAAAAPESLGAMLGKIAAGAAAAPKAAAGGRAGALAAAKGGIAMKLIAGAVVLGAVAGAVAVSTGLGGRRSPSMGDGKPAPANPHNGVQEREEVYEFTQKPSVKKEGEKWVITFASKGKCDATVSILNKDGRVVRHLASGVLGKNAPWPFQQNSLSQKIEWDGQTDDFKKAPAGCRVRVSLGLKAEFERNMAYDPNDLPDGAYGVTQMRENQGKYLVATGSDGNLYVLAMDSFIAFQGRVFDKAGKYVRTFWPPKAADLEKVAKIGIKLATTKWGDKTPVTKSKVTCFSSQGDMRKKPVSTAGKAMFDLVGIADFKEAARPEVIPASPISETADRMFAKVPRMAADHATEELYAGNLGCIVRFNGKTGEMGPSWKTPGRHGKPDTLGKRYGDTTIGPDGLVYARVGEHERFLMRTDRDGKIVPFAQNAFPPKNALGFDGKRFGDRYGGPHWDLRPGCLVTGSMGSGNTYMNAIDVTEDGTILLDIHSWQVKDLSDPKAMRVALADSNKTGTAAKALGVEYLPDDFPLRKNKGGYFITLWKNDGTLITRDAVAGKGIGDGAYMDRDGNIYVVQGGVFPAGQNRPYGITDVESGGRGRGPWGGYGCLVKFRGQGGKYPVGRFHGKMGYYGDQGTPVPAGAEALKLTWGGKPMAASGALWAFDVTNQSANDCNCPHARWYLDPYARPFLPANQLCSVVVLDSNGNVIARLGRYGNVDDTDEDVKEGRDGLRFIWIRAVTTSDTALYVMDYGNRRVLKAKLSSHAEEEVALDGSASSAFAAPPPKKAAPAMPAPGATATAKQDVPAASTPDGPTPASAKAEAAVVCRGWLSLAVSYKRAGRKDKAREYLARIIEQHPGTDYAARAKRELAGL